MGLLDDLKKGLGLAGQVLDAPRRAIFETFFDPLKAGDQHGFGDLVSDVDWLPHWAKQGIGLAGDIGTDPLSWVAPGAAGRLATRGMQGVAPITRKGLEQAYRQGSRAASRVPAAFSDDALGRNLFSGGEEELPALSWRETTENVPTDFLSQFRRPGGVERPEAVESLVQSLRAYGPRQPLEVAFDPERQLASLREGYHRLEAAQQAGLGEMPVDVYLEDLSGETLGSGAFPVRGATGLQERFGAFAPSEVFPDLPRSANPVEFADALQRAMGALGDRSGFLTPYSADELAAMGDDAQFFLSHGGQVGGALYKRPQGVEIGSLFNAGGPKGSGSAMLNALKGRGGNYLEAFESLKPVYEKAGFRETDRLPWNAEYAPEGWNYEQYGTPDYLTMNLADEAATQAPPARQGFVERVREVLRRLHEEERGAIRRPEPGEGQFVSPTYGVSRTLSDIDSVLRGTPDAQRELDEAIARLEGDSYWGDVDELARMTENARVDRGEPGAIGRPVPESFREAADAAQYEARQAAQREWLDANYPELPDGEFLEYSARDAMREYISYHPAVLAADEQARAVYNPGFSHEMFELVDPLRQSSGSAPETVPGLTLRELQSELPGPGENLVEQFMRYGAIDGPEGHTIGLRDSVMRLPADELRQVAAAYGDNFDELGFDELLAHDLNAQAAENVRSGANNPNLSRPHPPRIGAGDPEGPVRAAFLQRARDLGFFPEHMSPQEENWLSSVVREADGLARNDVSWLNDEELAYVLRGLDEGDPAVLDALPNPLSGEFADDYPYVLRMLREDPDLVGDLAAPDLDRFNDFADAFRQVYDETYAATVERRARELGLGLTPDDAAPYIDELSALTPTPPGYGDPELLAQMPPGPDRDRYIAELEGELAQALSPDELSVRQANVQSNPFEGMNFDPERLSRWLRQRQQAEGGLGGGQDLFDQQVWDELEPQPAGWETVGASTRGITYLNPRAYDALMRHAIHEPGAYRRPVSADPGSILLSGAEGGPQLGTGLLHNWHGGAADYGFRPRRPGMTEPYLTPERVDALLRYMKGRN